MGNYLPRSVDKASDSQDDRDNLLIPMEDVQYAAVSSSDDPSPEPTLGRPAGSQAVEEAFLMDISANKEWIAYVVKKSEPDQGGQFYLRIRNITYPSTGAIHSTGSLEENITDYMKCLDALTYCFLSISSNGERVAISFCKFDHLGNLTSKEPTCWTFRVVESEIKPDKSIECQGKAVFTPDDHLAIVSKNILKLYNRKKDYTFASCLDISYLFPSDEQMQRSVHPRATQIFWNSSFNGPFSYRDKAIDRMLSPLQAILHLTRFVKYNLLAPCVNLLAVSGIGGYYDGGSVWSLADGVKSLPLNLTEEILAISSDKTLVATFGDKSTYLSVYHLKSGLLISKLESQNIKIRQQFPLPYWWPKVLYCAHFSKDNEYIFLISIYDNSDSDTPNGALFMVEVWSRNAEKLIFRSERRIDKNWRSKNAPEPYIIESDNSPPTFTAVYATLSENGTFIFDLVDLEVFDNVTPWDWDVETSHTKTSEEYTVACTKSVSSDREYLLHFGTFAVELWCNHKLDNEIQKHLIYVRAFKSPRYHQGEGFKEEWILENYEESRSAIQRSNQLLSLGIRFTRTEGRIAVSIKYEGQFIQESRSAQNNTLLHQDEIYLPLEALQLAEAQTPFEFVCSDFHYIESVCRGLHFFFRRLKETKEDIWPDERKKELIEHYTEKMKQTKKLIERSIEQMQYEKSRYFTTISGSNTLAMLASFQDGRDIISQILLTDDLPINIISYVRKVAMTEKLGTFEDRNENALTILIEQFDYELFDLLFNRILLYSTHSGVGAFCAITEALVFLQGRGETIVFRNSCKKLRFLAMKSNFGKLEKHQWDANIVMSIDTFHQRTDAEFSDFSSYVTQEQISRLHFNWGVRTMQHLRLFARGFQATIHEALLNYRYYRRLYYKKYYSGSVSEKLLSVCAVPFIHFSSYTIFWEDVEFEAGHSNRDDETWKARLKLKFCKLLYPSYTQDATVHKTESDLMQLASKQHANDLFHQKGSVIEVLLNYKWKTFIRKRFYLVCFIHFMYYLSFCIGVLFARECFNYTIGNSILNSPLHIVSIALMFVANFILSAQELLQFLKIGFLGYFKSFYNIVDLVALVMPPVSFWLMITGNTKLDEISAIATIVIWMHGILRLRPIASIGVTVETMIQLMKSVYKTLIMMLFVIFAFTHAFIILLFHKDDSYFQEQFSGSINLNNSENAVSYSDSSASNSFTNPFKAFSTLWLFIYGVWDPITDGDAGDDVMIIVFAMLFSFVTVLLFFNLVIALMSSKAEQVKSLGKSIWLSHFAEVIAEIELFWCSKAKRINRQNSPSVVYYIAKYTDVRHQAELLEQETDSLIKELKQKLEKRQRASRSI